MVDASLPVTASKAGPATHPIHPTTVRFDRRAELPLKLRTVAAQEAPKEGQSHDHAKTKGAVDEKRNAHGQDKER
jgi:hypothetical protein